MSSNKRVKSIFNIIDDEQNCCSELKINNYKLNWLIKNLELICKTKKILISTKFPGINIDYIQWYIKIELTELNEDNNEGIFKFTIHNTNDIKKQIYFDIFILNLSQEIVKFISNSPNLNTDINWTIRASELYKKLIDNNSQLSQDITIICKLSVVNELTNILQKSLKPLNNTLLSDELLSKIENSFSNESFKDVAFHVEDEVFTAHKLILSLRSSVFTELFHDNMSEQVISFVKIDDINAKIFQRMLLFIYTDKINDLKEFAMDLYCAAEKYKLNNLKIICINNLYETLSCENAIKTLEFADKFAISNLRAESLKFIVSNLPIIRERKEFIELIKTNSQLTIEIFNMFELKDKKLQKENQSQNIILPKTNFIISKTIQSKQTVSRGSVIPFATRQLQMIEKKN
ncbi:protein roadkill-like [Leptopilina boulardi]|uniref:protein roadkill-like n=1 Tax=Leptopilina boulardi TaxID=63433 RepID=UPI0021F610A4|nr:protein roadkill-like [Leptopilina boulardi]